MRAHAVGPLLTAILLLATPPAPGQVVVDEAAAGERTLRRMRVVLEGLVARGLPGASASILLPGGVQVSAAVGRVADDEGRELTPDDRLLAGSVGKTFVTAVAHRLADAGVLDLDARAASWFEDGAGADPAWLERVPNARAATLRQLLQHTAGMPRYVFVPAFFERVVAEPDEVWTGPGRLAYLFDAAPLNAPGAGFAYADTHYIVLGMVIEAATGRAFYDLAREHFVEPLALSGTVATDRRRVPGLVPGAIVGSRRLGFPERAVEDGLATYNLQFEWCGGGFASTPRDLARWARALYAGEALGEDSLASLLDAVDAPALGPGARYGLGVTLRDTPLGELRSHDGFMPGYLTTMGWFPEVELAAALQLNADDAPAVGRPLTDVLVELAAIAREELAAGD